MKIDYLYPLFYFCKYFFLQGKRRSGKIGRVQGRKGKITKKQGSRRTHKKTLKSGNAKSVGRVNEVGAGCEYVILSELTTRAKKCVNGNYLFSRFTIKFE